MAAEFPLTIVTPDGEIFQEDVVSLQAPGINGYFGVLAHHAPMIAEITRGVVTVRKEDDKVSTFAVLGGIIEVVENKVVVLADRATAAESAEDAKAKAVSGL